MATPFRLTRPRALPRDRGSDRRADGAGGHRQYNLCGRHAAPLYVRSPGHVCGRHVPHRCGCIQGRACGYGLRGNDDLQTSFSLFSACRRDVFSCCCEWIDDLRGSILYGCLLPGLALAVSSKVYISTCPKQGFSSRCRRIVPAHKPSEAIPDENADWSVLSPCALDNTMPRDELYCYRKHFCIQIHSLRC